MDRNRRNEVDIGHMLMGNGDDVVQTNVSVYRAANSNQWYVRRVVVNLGIDGLEVENPIPNETNQAVPADVAQDAAVHAILLMKRLFETNRNNMTVVFNPPFNWEYAKFFKS